MKNKALILAVWLYCTVLSAQTSIQYSYDANGNRTQRKLYVCNLCPPERQMKPENEKKQEAAAALGLSVFPNPAQDKINVAVASLKDEEVTILMIDAQGKNLFEKKTRAQQNEVDMTPYKAGVYFIKVVVGKESLFYKVMKL